MYGTCDISGCEKEATRRCKCPCNPPTGMHGKRCSDHRNAKIEDGAEKVNDLYKVPPFQVTTYIDIKDEQIRNLLVTAFEGGSNYWYEIMSYENPDDEKVNFKHCDLPLTKRGAVIIGDIEDEDEGPWRLDRFKCQRGLQAMSDKYHTHFMNFVNENDDAITGDVYLQCCLFGEVVYG